MTRPDIPEYRIHQAGEHKGELITRVPVKYLLWMIRTRQPEAELAEAELKRRGSVIPTLELSGHAIDRASQFCLRIWKKTRTENEGIYAWLMRMSEEAVKLGKKRKQERVAYAGMVFVLDYSGIWPMLLTVMRDYHPPKQKRPRFFDPEDQYADDDVGDLIGGEA